MAIERFDRGDFFKLKKIDAELSSVAEKMHFLAINPLNINDVKKEVFEDSNANPHFEYGAYPYNLDQIMGYLNSIDRHDSFLGSILETKRKIYLDTARMFLSRGTDDFSRFSRLVYGVPKPSLVDMAYPLLELDSVPAPRHIPAEKAADILDAELRHYGFGYSVLVTDMSASAAVAVAEKKVFLQKGHFYSLQYLHRLIIHEIGTHVLRAENGRNQQFKVFLHGFPGYLATEEGLAVVNEERFGLLEPEVLKKYSARTLAVDLASRASFSEVYGFLCEHLTRELAFTTALRVKRGLGDSSHHGGCTKDFAYLDGYFRVKQFLERGGSLKSLYYGKVGVEHTHSLPLIPGLSAPRHLPQNQSFKSLLEFI